MSKTLFCLAWLLCFSLAAQKPPRSKVDSLPDTLTVKVLDWNYFEATGQFHDLPLHWNARNMRFMDPAMQLARLNASLGNLGSAAYPLRPRFDFALSPRLGWSSHLANQYLPEDVPYYSSARPFSQITYQLGSASEHFFEALHTQSFFPGFQAGLRFRHQNSEGFYQRQDAVHSNAQAMLRYKSPSGVYALAAHFTHNSHTVEENGGLVNDSNLILGGLFTSDGNFLANTNRSTYPVRFTAADRQGFRNHFGWRQVWTPGGKISPSDSGNTIGRISLMHAFSYENFEDRFRDEAPNAMYYPNLLLDSLQSRHRLEKEQLRNTAGLNMFLNKKSRSGSPLSLEISHAWYHLYSAADTLQQADTSTIELSRLETIGHQVDLTGRLTFDLGKSLRADAGASFVLTGYNLGDVHGFFETRFDARDSLGQTKGVGMLLRADARLLEPDFLAQSFTSNAKTWEQNLGKTLHWQIKASLEAPLWQVNVKGGMDLLTNYVWWNAAARPEQNGGTATLLSLEASKYHRLGPFDFGWFVLGQYSSSQNIPLPNLIAHADISYTNVFFRGNLDLRIGLDVFYLSPFKGMGYDPFTGRFFAQEAQTTGNYPFVDVYVAAHIRTAWFYVKVRHINQGIVGNHFFISPHFPMQDRSLQLGLKWNFFN